MDTFYMLSRISCICSRPRGNPEVREISSPMQHLGLMAVAEDTRTNREACHV